MQALAEHGADRDLDHRHAGDLAEERHRAARAGVDLDHEDIAVATGAVAHHDVLDVHQPAHAQADADLARVFDDRADFPGEEVGGGVDRHRVAGVHAGALDVLHDAGNQHLVAAADRVDLDLDAGEILVDQHGLAGRRFLGLRDEAGEIAAALDDLHRATAEHVGGAYEHGVTDRVGGEDRFINAVDAGAGRLGDPEVGEEALEAAAVFGDVDRFGGRAEDRVGPRRSADRRD